MLVNYFLAVVVVVVVDFTLDAVVVPPQPTRVLVTNANRARATIFFTAVSEKYSSELIGGSAHGGPAHVLPLSDTKAPGLFPDVPRIPDAPPQVGAGKGLAAEKSSRAIPAGIIRAPRRHPK